MTTPQDIISDAEIERHHYGDFGPVMTPREVVNEGVLKYAHGFSSGHTVLTILRDHKLLKKPRPGSYRADLTQKGKAYARTLYVGKADLPPTLAQAMQVPEVKALVELVEYLAGGNADHIAVVILGNPDATNDLVDRARALTMMCRIHTGNPS
jgi:hypothetical protein